MTAGLKRAVEELHTAFADVPQPARITGCTHCCISEEELARLVEVPRAELTADELKSYAWNVPDTVGTEADFKYFLPRIFELVAEGELQEIGAGWTLRRLKYTAWTSWSPEQMQAIRAYLMAWWQMALMKTARRDDTSAMDVFFSIVETDESPESYLSFWEQAKTLAASDHLALTIQFLRSDGEDSLDFNVYAPDKLQTHHLLNHWFLRPSVLTRLNSGVATASSDMLPAYEIACRVMRRILVAP
ncbi:hypothetical protein [Deinococcus aquiradiocola]|uniref:Uncharacterized protein n=1 Tax=Deinococcus aquiradiocola TaxID=393059 RepID=A0A917UMC7_9DEIO|nr:hypothetical protein [Deinococcus aquiradiocola]GGJ67934.1 hypothetical protein GCM10008939_10370 [Deinococcus aquiradiocola]